MSVTRAVQARKDKKEHFAAARQGRQNWGIGAAESIAFGTLDLPLPRTNGGELAEAIQTDEYFQFNPVAIVAAPCRPRQVETRLDEVLQELAGFRVDVDDLPVTKATHGG